MKAEKKRAPGRQTGRFLRQYCPDFRRLFAFGVDNDHHHGYFVHGFRLTKRWPNGLSRY
jgi:hypothetical protein